VNDVQDGDQLQPQPEPGPVHEPELAPESHDEPAQYRMRRAPRYRSFCLTGVILGVVIGLVLALSHPANGDYSARTIAAYFAVICGLIGGFAGLATALLLERWRA
jgi:hypothetical protein